MRVKMTTIIQKAILGSLVAFSVRAGEINQTNVCPKLTGSEWARNLSAYKCDDGTTPDGTNKNHDDTSALKAALADGPGMVRINPGYYRFGNVTIPAKVIVVGAGPATIIRSNGEKIIFRQNGVGEWGLKDLLLDGESDKPTYETPDNGKQGLTVNKCHAFTINEVIVCKFEGKAVEFSGTDLAAAAFCNGGTISGLTAYGNYAGLAFSRRAEYMTATQVKSYKNVFGCIINGGNNSIGESHFCENDCGILLKDEDNGSHGSVNSCLINHNRRYAICATNVLNGHNFIGCNIFYGAVELSNCKGIKISSGSLGCPLSVSGEHANQISGNYIVENLLKPCNLGKAVIVKDNFTDKGPWTPPGQ